MPLPPDSLVASDISAAGRPSAKPYLSVMMRGGPLPPAEELAAYSQEARELILRMAEREQLHRHALETGNQQLRRDRHHSRALDRQARRKEIARGQSFGLLFCVLFLVAGVIVALFATSPWGQFTATILGGLGLSTLVFVFMRGRHPKIRRPRRLRLQSSRSRLPKAAPQSN